MATMPSPAPAAAAVRAPSAGSANEKEEALRKWLEGLDSGRGALVCYLDVIKNEFDCDFGQISAVRLSNPETPGLLGTIDPVFWETCGIKAMGHKLLFAKGISKLS